MLMRNTSAPARTSPAITALSTVAGPSVAMILTRLSLLISVSKSQSRSRRYSTALMSLRWRVRIGELHRPTLGVAARVDLEEAGPVVAAGETVLTTVDSELAVACAHEGLALPLPAALVHRIDVVELGGKRPAQQRLAGGGTEVPPPFRQPAFPVRIGDRDADARIRVVAETKVGARRR